MITIKIKFLLAFPPKPIEKSKRGQKPGKTNLKVVDLPDYVIKVETPSSLVHLEYELVPNKCKYQIDVICWKNAAKIFTADGCKILKPVVTDDLVWVPICIEHYLQDLTIQEIYTLHSYVVEFSITNDPKKLGNAAKSDKSVFFYTYEDEAHSTKFCDIFNEKPAPRSVDIGQLKTEALEREIREIIMRCVNFPDKEPVSWLNYNDNYADILYELIEDVVNGKGTRYYRPFFADKHKNENKEAKGKSPKKDKNTSKNKSPFDTFSMKLQAEIFFTDTTLTIFKNKDAKKAIRHCFILLSTNGILNKSQKMLLDPLVIKIKKMNNLPVEILKRLRITDVFCTYSIPDVVFPYRTPNSPMERKVIVEDSKIYFTSSAPKIKLLEFCETKMFTVEIYGIKNPLFKNTEEGLFGCRLNDTFVSKIDGSFNQFLTDKATCYLLGVCKFDISSLANNTWDFREKTQWRCPDVEKNYKSIDCIDVLTINEINARHTPMTKYILNEALLSEYSTTLEIEAYLLAPHATSLILDQVPHTYKRFIFIAFEKSLAYMFFMSIFSHNETVYCQEKNYTLDTSSDIITGFLIDNGNNYAFFCEGLTRGYILNLWNHINKYQPDEVKVFFNTDFAFENRIYEEFLDMDGLCYIVLKMPLQSISADQKLYITGNTPVPCFRALMKLNLLLNSKTLKSILQHDLLPTAKELISLRFEYGLATKWHDQLSPETAKISFNNN